MVTIPTPIDKDESPLLNEKEATQYRSIVGSLLCSAVCTRPDLMYTVSKLGSKVSKPSQNDKAILKRTLRYVQDTLDKKLTFKYQKNKEVDPIGYSDASYGTGSSMLSQYGYVFTWNGCPISQCQKTKISIHLCV